MLYFFLQITLDFSKNMLYNINIRKKQKTKKQGVENDDTSKDDILHT